MNNKAKLRPLFSLQFFEGGDDRGDLFRARSGIRPVCKKTIAEIFVNHSVPIFDDLIATENPRTEKNIQVLALNVATEGRKAANVRDEKPTRNLLDFPQRSLHHVRFVLL